MMKAEQHNILVVDDEIINITMLANMLNRAHYQVTIAKSGRRALQVAEQLPYPDLILLDVRMPEMDGYEVCRRLKANPATAHIPILFVTSLDTEQDMVTGLALGALDYLTKPLKPPVVLAKLHNILSVQLLQRQLEQKVDAELIRNERMNTLGQMVAGFTHDLISPLAVLNGTTSVLENATKRLRQLIQQEEVDEAELIKRFDQIDEVTILTQRNLKRAHDMVASFKRLSMDQTSEFSRPFPLRQLLEDVVLGFNHLLRRTQITVTIDCDTALALQGRPGALAQVINNLLHNSWLHAFDRGHRPGVITINASASADQVTIDYSDNGSGIAPEIQTQIFERFFTTATEQGGSGIGLHNCAELMRHQLGGTIEYSSDAGAETHFVLRLPLQLEVV